MANIRWVRILNVAFSVVN